MFKIFTHIIFHDNFTQKTRSTQSIYFFKDTVRRPRVFKNPFLIAMSSHENRNTQDRNTGCRVFTLGFTTTGFSMGLLVVYYITDFPGRRAKLAKHKIGAARHLKMNKMTSLRLWRAQNADGRPESQELACKLCWA